ncbi:MAG: polyprenyl synthetase family protein, partial [Bacteroidia bacterium]|nr:polyprenyl synthetase family protein [Bacteroidia bacterium]
EVCEGQQFDMDFEKKDDISIDQYMNMISLKTAVLIGCCMRTGAIIGGASVGQANDIYEFGKNIGMVFQLQDDILDVYGDAEKFGKQVGGDIVANKKTYLLLKAFECAEKKQFDSLKELLEDRSIKLANDEKVKKVTEIYDELGVRELAELEMEKYYSKAIEKIDHMGMKNTDSIVEYANKLSLRQH